MKSFYQFYEQAVASAPAPTPAAVPAPKVAKAQPKSKPKVTDPSSGVDIDDDGRWKGDIVDQGKVIKPEQKIKVKDGKKGPDPDLPSGEANPNKKKRDDLNSLMNKAPGTHTAAERQRLIDAGLDDFARGGKTQSPVGDAAMLGLTYAGVKGAGALATKVGVGAAANRVAKGAKTWWNYGRNTRIPNENQAKFGSPSEYFKKNPNPKNLFGDDALQRGMSDAAFAAGKAPRGIGRPDQAFNPFRPASKGGPGSAPTPAVRQAFERPVRTVRDALKGLRK